MSFSGETDKMCSSVYILIVLISLSSLTFANVEFVTEPPEEVRTFPGLNVKLPCVLENLLEQYHIVEWAQMESYDQINTISNNREVLITNLENFGQHFSILGDGLNFTLLIIIPDENSIDFGTSTTINTTYMCSVIDPYIQPTNKVVLTTKSKVIIQKWTFMKPICLSDLKTYYVSGETLQLGCYINDPTIITTLKSDGQILPTEFYGQWIHNLTITKEDHNATFVCESRRNGTNEIRSCSKGPITVNYKPEITITQSSPLEFHCTAEARPPVKVTRWILEPSIPEDSFTISNEVLKITEPSKVDSEMKITCVVGNSVGRETKTLNISNNQDEEGKDSISVVIIVVSVLSCVVAVFLILLLWFLRRKRNRNQLQHESKSKNTDKFGGHDHHQVNMKNQDPKELEYDYAAINLNEFHAEYHETENEIYDDGDRLSKDETNAANNKLSYKKREDLDQYREHENEIYEGPNMDTDCEGQGLKGEKQQVYSQVNKPDYKECENEIYQGSD